MRLVEFSPDSQSRYLVGVARLLECDAVPVGGTEDAVLVTFGHEHQLRSALFEFNPSKHPFLDPVKVGERLQLRKGGELVAATLAIAYVLGRESLLDFGDGVTVTPDRVGWLVGWQSQLTPLVAYLASTKGGDGDAAS